MRSELKYLLSVKVNTNGFAVTSGRPFPYYEFKLLCSTVFKVFSIEEERFTEKINLRSAQQRPNLNYVAVDVVWSPREENIIASASSNGSVVLWDLNKNGKNKQG